MGLNANVESHWFEAAADCRSSYQRTPTLDGAVTEWLTTIAAWSLKTRYASRYISRSPSESSFWLLGWAIQVPPPHASPNRATGISGVAWVSVAAPNAKFGLNWYRRRLLKVSKFKK